MNTQNKMFGKLGVYHFMIVSKYFKSIDDFINLEISTRKAKGNMEKFHYNPIALDAWSRTLFCVQAVACVDKDERFYNILIEPNKK